MVAYTETQHTIRERKGRKWRCEVQSCRVMQACYSWLFLSIHLQNLFKKALFQPTRHLYLLAGDTIIEKKKTWPLRDFAPNVNLAFLWLTALPWNLREENLSSEWCKHRKVDQEGLQSCTCWKTDWKRYSQKRFISDRHWLFKSSSFSCVPSIDSHKLSCFV